MSEVAERMESLVSRYAGVVSRAYELLNATDDARLVRIGCERADGTAVIGHGVSGVAGGIGESRDQARAAAIGEAAERYSAALVPTNELVTATARELGPTAVEPERFALFAARQHAEPGFPYRPFTRDTRVPWCRGFAIPDGRRVWLPAELVYLARIECAGAAPIAHPTSSGLACGASVDDAILGGLLEALERDAFMLTWAARLSLPRLDAAGDATLSEFDRIYLEPTGLRYSVVDLSVFWDVPTALALVHGAGADGCALAVGAAAAPAIGLAWRKAVAEAFAVRAWVRSLSQRDGTRRFRDDFSDVETFDDHLLLYSGASSARWASFLDSAREVRHVDAVAPLQGRDARGRILAICERLAARGTSAYAVDVTAPDIARAGLRVVKVIAPELCPLDVMHAARFLGGHRLYRAAHAAGLVSAPMEFDELNPYPHPFP